MSVERAFLGGRVETMDESGRLVEAVAVAGGRIAALGSADEIASLCGPDADLVDLDGAALLPGFVDTHMHLEKIAREMAMLQLENATSLSEVLAAVAEHAARAQEGEWVRSFGDDDAWHERQLAEGRLPTREELDRVCPDRPVFLYRGPDAAVLNGEAAALLADALAPLGAATWEASSGLLGGTEARELEARLPSPGLERELADLGDASEKLLGMGITTVVDPGLPASFASSWELYRSAQEQGMLRQRVVLMNRLDPRLPFAEELARFRADLLRLDGQDDRLRAGALKLILDGEFSNAWMRSGERASGEPLRRYSPAELRQALDLCAAQHWPLCVHAMGGGAIECIIDAVEGCLEAGGRLEPAQVSIAHAFCASEADAAACARLGIACSVQPMLAYSFEHAMCDAWGSLAEHANPLATLRASGAVVAGGSDTLPCEPLRGARYAVDRRARHGTVLGLAQALTPRQALELFTIEAGRYLRRGDLGVLRPGARADLVVWDDDPLQHDPADWLELTVELVALDGEIAWRRDGTPGG